MKRLFTLLMVAFVAFSCEMLDGALDSKGKGLTFAEGTETTATFKARGGSATFEFTADLDWTVTTSDEWITVTPESGSAGEGEIKVKVAENEDVEERTGYVDITLSNDKSFRIEVEQKEGDPIFEIGADGEIKVKAAGGEVEIEVTTNIDYEVYIPEDAESWIEYVETRSVRNETVVFSVSKNSTSTKREAVIELRDEAGDTLEEFTIEQAAAEGAEDEEPVFEVGDDGEYIVKATGGDVEVDVRTNLEYSVYIPKDVRSWVEYVETRSVRNETVVLSVAENDSEAERTAVIELRDASGDTLEEITIVQRGKSAEDEEPVFEIGDNGEYIVEATGGDVEVDVTTNLEYSVYIPKDVRSWVEYVETRSVRNETVVLSVAKNDSEAERTAVIELRDESGDTLEEITIVQRGKSAEDEEPGSEVPNKEIWYTTTDGMELDPYDTTGFGANLIDNTYVDGKGVLHFDGDVTAIGEEAFYDCSSLTSITIPNSVTAIGDDAFEFCSSLTSITIPDSVTTIGDFAFEYCDSLTSVTIPDSVTTIGGYAFYACDSLTEFKGKFASEDGRCLIIDGTLNSFAPAGVTEYTIPNSVTAIGDGAFEDCISLTSVIIPDSVTTIGGYAFSVCDSLTSITIPNSVTEIGDGAFCICRSLESVYCKPTTPPSIYDSVFDGNASGRKIYVPAESVAAYQTAEGWSDYADSIVGYEFESGEVPNNEIWYTTTDGMEFNPHDVTVFGANLVDNTYVNGKGVLLFDGDVTAIGADAFYKCSSLTSITIPDSVTTIGTSAFYACSSLTSITIPNSVTAIGAWAFYNCSSLTSITIPDIVTTIGGRAFLGCSSLTSITIPNSVTTIGGSAFCGCSSLTEFKGKFASEDGRCLIIDGTLNSFAPAGVTEYTIPNSVTAIGDGAFEDCISLVSVTIGDSVTTIGGDAFYACSSLQSVTIGNSVTTIGALAFAYCSSLTSVTIGNDVTSIGYGAFYECSSLTSVTIPDSVTTIGNYAFYGCSSLQSVTIGNSVTTIGDYAFNSCTNLSSLDLGNGVESIGFAAFAYCYNLESVTIPDSVTTLSDALFCGCYNIQQFEGKFAHSSGLCLIVDDRYIAFAAGVSGAIYEIPAGVTTIGVGAFENTHNIAKIVVPDSVTGIERAAFYNCDGLQSVDFYSQTLNSVGDSIFAECDILSYIRVPYQAYYTYWEAFGSAVMVVAYDYENDVEVDMAVEPTDLAKRWIGTWSSTVQSTYCLQTEEFDNTPVTFDIEITAHPMYSNRVLVTGLIVSDPSLALVGIVNDDGSLGILNYQELYSDGTYMYFVSGLNEQWFLSMDDSNFAAYTMTMDDYGNVSCTVGTIDNLPIIMYCVFALDKATGDIYFTDTSLSYYSGPMTWERVGGDESDLEDSGEETPNEWSSTAPLFKQPKIDKTLSKKLSIASKRAM